MAQVVKSDLAAIGIDVEVKTFPLQALFEREGRKGAPYDLGFGEWLVDYPDPEDFLKNILEGPIFSDFDSPAFQRKLAAAAKLSGPARYLAYEKLDSDLVRNGAPWSLTATSSTTTSSRRAWAASYRSPSTASISAPSASGSKPAAET